MITLKNFLFFKKIRIDFYAECAIINSTLTGIRDGGILNVRYW